jgi:hypothetical protein
MKSFAPLFCLFFIFSGCAVLAPRIWDPYKNSATQASHQKILQELEENSKRSPASLLSDFKINFRALRALSPAKFEVYVFPKISSQNSKELDNDESYLGPPRVFEISILAVNPCSQFINEGLFSKYRAREAFPAELAEGNNRHCAILQITDKYLMGLDKALLRQDDQLSLRIFIDDTYKLHAIDHIHYVSRGDIKIVRRIGENEALSSDLSFFPVDLPFLNSKMKPGSVDQEFSNLLDPVALFQIQQKYSASFRQPKCDGVTISQFDSLSGNTRIGWCQGVPWPSYIENLRFFSVSTPLGVK